MRNAWFQIRQLLAEFIIGLGLQLMPWGTEKHFIAEELMPSYHQLVKKQLSEHGGWDG